MKNKKNLSKAIFLALLLGVGISALLFNGVPASAQTVVSNTNLIANPSLEINQGNLPQGWNKNMSFLNRTIFTYPVAGYNSPKAAKVEITRYFMGNAEWYFNYVPVTAGQTYYFSDNYLSNTTSSIMVIYRLPNGILNTVKIATLPAAASWQQAQISFTVPAGVKSLTIFHLLDRVGWLTVDNYSLSLSTDSVAPTVSLIGLTDGQVVSGKINLTADAKDNIGVAGVQFVIDGVNFGAEITSPPYQKSLDTTALSNGSHTIAARARDAAGNKTTSVAVSVVVTNVGPAQPTISTSATTPVTIGQGIKDTATISGLVNPLGTAKITFTLYSNDTCTTQVTTSQSGGFVTANATYDSAAYITINAGTYYWIASFPGDANNKSVATACKDANESSIVNKAQPTISTTPSAGGVIGITLNDTATLSGGFNATGPVTFKLFPPSDTTCSGAASYTDTDPSAPYATSPGFISNASGDWHWTADYAGDANNKPVSSPCANEAVTITNIQSTNLIINPSLEISDASNTYPLNWNKGNWGTNQAIFTYPVAGHNSDKAEKVEMLQYTYGDAKWYFDDVAVSPGTAYEFSDYYISNTPSVIVVRFTLSDGTFNYLNLAYLNNSADWQIADKVFTTPMNAVSVTVFHLISSVGVLTVDDFSLIQTVDVNALSQGMVSLNLDDGWLSSYQNAIPILNQAGLKITENIITSELNDPIYVNASQILDIQAAGHEIGSHSRTHPFLTQLSPVELESEIVGSKQDLLDIGVNQVVSFAYPNADVNNTVINAVKNAGYQDARNSQPGFNNKITNPFLLQIQSVESNVTFDTIKGWIDQAVKTKTWLILLFHKVEVNGGQYSTTPEIMQQIVDYLVQQNVKVVTNSQGAQILSQP